MSDAATFVRTGRETLRSDGKAVDVAFVNSTPKEKGTPWYQDGFFGILMAAASSGDTVSMEIAQRVHEIVVAGGVTAALGDVLYIDKSTRAIGNDTNDVPFGRVVKAKDSNNVCWVLLLPQYTDTV